MTQADVEMILPSISSIGQIHALVPEAKTSSAIESSVRSIVLSCTGICNSRAISITVFLVIHSRISDVTDGVTRTQSRTMKIFDAESSETCH